MSSGMDRSVMFTSLLAQPGYGGLDARVGEAITTEALAAWRASGETNMHAFTSRWWAGRSASAEQVQA